MWTDEQLKKAPDEITPEETMKTIKATEYYLRTYIYIYIYTYAYM